MRIGFASMNTPSELPAADLAVALESRGYDSLWMGEHSHIPTSRRTPYPAGGELPAPYLEMMDPYVSLTLAAAATEHLLVGTSVALPLERDLFSQAKTIATLDRVSGGRFQFGVGVGWNEEELANHHPVPWRQRYTALAECVAALRALWATDPSSFHGTWYDFEPVWSRPKPQQAPHPPIWCGTGGKLGTRHAVEWADGWMPIDVSLGDVAKKVDLFRRAAADAGRGVVPISLIVFGDPDPSVLHDYRALDLDRVIVGPARRNWHDGSTTLAFLDRYADHVDELDRS